MTPSIATSRPLLLPSSPLPVRRRNGRRHRGPDRQLTVTSARNARSETIVLCIFPKLADFLGWRGGERVALAWQPHEYAGVLRRMSDDHRGQSWKLSAQITGSLQLRISVRRCPELRVERMTALRWRRQEDGSLRFWFPVGEDDAAACERSPLPRYNGVRILQLLACMRKLMAAIRSERDLRRLWVMRERLAKVVRVYRRCF